MDRLIGTQLGDFTIIERIGQGGTAAVYRAEQASMKRDVALKVINVIEASEHGDFYKRFEREAAVIASLEHGQFDVATDCSCYRDDIGIAVVG